MYKTLGVHCTATTAELRKVYSEAVREGLILHYFTTRSEIPAADLAIFVVQAYRRLAKSHHPDRGGSDAAFSQLQQAFEVLSDPRQREVYDTWARQVQFRYLPDARTQVRA